MKKSYDYFKTLKELSNMLFEAYNVYCDSKALNKEYLCFSALKNELSENLINEFVAPIERNDIYKLSFCLNEEFGCVMSFSDFLGLSDTNSFEYFGQIGDLFYKQSELFDFYGLLKLPQKALKNVSLQIAECKKIKKSINAETRAIIVTQNQPLITYIIASSCVDIVSSVERTYNEIGRVLINNS